MTLNQRSWVLFTFFILFPFRAAFADVVLTFPAGGGNHCTIQGTNNQVNVSVLGTISTVDTDLTQALNCSIFEVVKCDPSSFALNSPNSQNATCTCVANVYVLLAKEMALWLAVHSIFR